ncbi:hypothetical protein O1L68_40255 [Streptomyces lydicus]|nr:hypothetical protein [Streptomyces lydicus]
MASWDATLRLENRGMLLWLAQQITEARRVAQAVLDQTDRPYPALQDALDITVPPQVRHAAASAGAEQLAAALQQARRDVERLATATPRSARRTLTRLAGDLAEADEAFDRVCNDVLGADLRAVDLDHAYLGGLRWDDTTQWPTGWRDRMSDASDSAKGVHQVRDD